MIGQKVYLQCLFLLSVVVGCNKRTPISFPEELQQTQPESMPLVLSEKHTMTWDTIHKGSITPRKKYLNLNDLPSEPIDSSGFHPFIESPKVVRFNFETLPDTTIDFEHLESTPLEFTTSFVEGTVVYEKIPLVEKPGKPISIYDFDNIPPLSNLNFGSTLIDHDNLLWIGGADGLFRYDGIQLVQYVKTHNTSATINGIAEDKAGNIWFSQLGVQKLFMLNRTDGILHEFTNASGLTNNITLIEPDHEGQLWMFNGMNLEFQIIDPVALTYKTFGMNSGLSDSLSFHMKPDKNNNLWISTFSAGLTILNPSTGNIKYLTSEDGLSSDSLAAVEIDQNGIIWVSTHKDINAIDPQNETITHYGPEQYVKPGYQVTLKSGPNNQLWFNNENNLGIINPVTQEFRSITSEAGLFSGFKTNILFDNQQRAWVISYNGINLIDQLAATTHSLGTTPIVAMHEDDDQNLWVATQNGLIIIDADRKTIKKLDQSNGLSHNFVQNISGFDGKIEVSTNGGFNLFDPQNNTMTIMGRNEGLSHDTIYCLINDQQNNLWITGPTKGVTLLDTKKELELRIDKSGGLADDNTMDIVEDREGYIWVALESNGVNKIDPRNGTIQHIVSVDGLHEPSQKALLVDHLDRIWVSTNHGIYIIDQSNETITNLTTRHGLSNNKILSLHPYMEKIIAGSDKMINIITPPNRTDSIWKLDILDQSEGITKRQTNSWNTDAITRKEEFLWGDQGITRFPNLEAETDAIPVHITGIEIMGDDFNFFTHKSHSFTDSSASGATKSIGFHPVFASMQKIRFNGVEGPYNLPKQLVLPHNKNYLQFSFAESNISRLSTTYYSYILEGIDTRWSEPSRYSYTENYLNLPPGKYNFKVSSKGIDGKWKDPATFSFSISRPWYFTWFALTAYLILALVLLRAYVIFRARKLKKENKLLEEKVAQRTQLLSQSIKDLKSTQGQLIHAEKMASLGELTAGIAHEIQNPLNFVNNFSELSNELIDEMYEELDRGEIQEAKNIAADIKLNLDKINHHGKRADAIVKNMLLHSRGNSGHKESTDLTALADEYLRLSFHGLRAKDKSFNANFKLEADENIPNVEVVPQDMGRVLLNLINNAFYAVFDKSKMSSDSYKPLVTVRIQKTENNAVEIRVKDNGNGIPEAVKDKIFQPFYTTKPAGKGTGLGLSLSYDIVKNHNGTLKVNTQKDTGTEFIIVLPLKLEI